MLFFSPLRGQKEKVYKVKNMSLSNSSTRLDSFLIINKSDLYFINPLGVVAALAALFS